MRVLLRYTLLFLLLLAFLTGGFFWELFWGRGFFLRNTGAIRVYSDHSVALQVAQRIVRSRSPKFYHTIEQVPQHTIDFLIFQEDQNFFQHAGYSLRDIFIVLYDHIWKGDRLRGASTLTQQLVRSLFIAPERSLGRKLVELRLARFMEQQLSKTQIIELYLNYVYWGQGVYGIGAASRKYFRRQPQALSVRQSVFLISLLPYPAACHRLSACRDKGILRRMRRLQNYYDKTLRRAYHTSKK